MHDPRRVRDRQGLGDLLADVRDLLPGQPPVPVDPRTQRDAGDELHHDPGRAFVLHHVVDSDHAGMVEPGGGTRLAHGAREQFGVLLG